MCYVYVRDVTDKTDPSIILRKGALSLVDHCIDLLLVDLDEYKARGLSDVERRVLMSRRSSHSGEKKRYLRYLAAQSYFDAKAVFPYTDLIATARRFFEIHWRCQEADEILRGLSSSDATANIVLQIIFSGVLVAVEQDKNSDGVFDFPHRRFREILASDYFDNESGEKDLIRQIDNSVFSELILVFTERTARHDLLTNAVLERIMAGTESMSALRLIEGCLHRLEPASIRSEIAWRVVEGMLAREGKGKLPIGLVSFLTKSDSRLELLEGAFRRAIGAADDWRLDLSGTALAALSATRMDELLSSLRRESFEASDGTASYLLKASAEFASRFGSEDLARIWPNRSFTALTESDRRTLRECIVAARTQPSQQSVTRAILDHFDINMGSEQWRQILSSDDDLGQSEGLSKGRCWV
jgi:hypothetical protein